MAAENDKDRRMLMSEELKHITDDMVFEGVTPKSGMKKVKAMKRLWRSDSFQMMKSILEEPPIQEGRARPPTIPLKDDDDDDLAETEASPRDTVLEKENKEKELEYVMRKEELGEIYQKCLEEDLEVLQMKNDEIIEEFLEKARIEVEEREVGHLDDVVKEKIEHMMFQVKCYKKMQNKHLKMAVEEDRKVMTTELKEYMEKDMEIRSKTYRQLLEKVYDYKLRVLEESIADEYEDQIRRRTRIPINKFEYAKGKLLKRQKKDLENLNCRLAAEFVEHEKWSENRINFMLADKIRNMDEREGSSGASDRSECSTKNRMESMLRSKGWLLWEPSQDEDWGSLVQELLRMYQIFLEVVFGDRQSEIKQNEFLLSLERLTSFKDRIAQVTKAKLTDTYEMRKRQKTRAQAKLRAASLLDYFIKQVLPSPLPSRYSYSELFQKPKLGKCHTRTSKNAQVLDDEQLKSALRSISHEYLKHPQSQIKSFAVMPKRESKVGIASPRTTEVLKSTSKQARDKSLESGQLGRMHSEEDRQTFVNILHDNPQLYNVFFFNL